MAFPVEWLKKKRVTIDHTKVSGSSAHTNFPVLITGANIPDDVWPLLQTGELFTDPLFDDSTLKAYYRFESGALTTDSSGEGHTLTPISDPAETTGKHGGGVALDGNDAYSHADHADFKPTGNFSIGVWFKTSDSGAQGLFQSYQAVSAVAGVSLDILSGGTLRFLSGNSTGGTPGTHFQTATSTFSVNDGEWHFGVGTWDGSTLRLYIDGRLAASAAWANAPVFDGGGGTNAIRFGCRNVTGSNANFLVGDMDEEFLFGGKALSPAEIKFLYHGGADLRFSSDVSGSTELAFEVVDLDIIGETAEINVKVPSVDDDTDTNFYMWYDNDEAVPYEAGDTYGSQNVWTGDNARYHFESDIVDSTGGNNLTADTSPDFVTGKIGTGAEYDGTSNDCLYDSSLNFTPFNGGATFRGWINAHTEGEGSANDYGRIFNGGAVLRISEVSTGTFKVRFTQAFGTTAGSWVSDNFVLTANTLHKIDVSYNNQSTSNDPIIYVDGQPIAITEAVTPVGTVTNNTTMYFGNNVNASGVRAFDGIQDEYGFSKTILSADWLATEFANQNDPATFLSINNLSSGNMLQVF